MVKDLVWALNRALDHLGYCFLLGSFFYTWMRSSRRTFYLVLILSAGQAPAEQLVQVSAHRR